jgi:AcrR family transcriptional regulator
MRSAAGWTAPWSVGVPTDAPGLREQKKQQTRRSIQEHALRMFLEQGYDETTVGQIAAAAGVSAMTFFRYFPVKEAVVDQDDYDPLIAALIGDRPAGESPLTAIRLALTGGLEQVYAADRDALLIRTRLILTTPALRSRMWLNQRATEELFAAALGPKRPALSALELRVLSAAALAALNTALVLWVESGGERDLPALVDEVLKILEAPSEVR